MPSPAATDAENHTTSYRYDGAGNRTQVLDANSHPTYYDYDALNRVITVTRPITTPSRIDLVTTYGYDPSVKRTTVTDPRGNSTTTEYDLADRVLAVTIPITGTETAATRYGYDAIGNRTVITDALSHVTTFEYDRLNRLTLTLDPANQSTRYGYDAVGNRTVITDALTNATHFTYDGVNRAITTTNPAGKTTGVGYDDVGNRIRTTDELGQTTRYEYDRARRLVTFTDPLTQTTTYGYDAVGNLLTRTDPGGQATTFTYYHNNWLKTKTLAGTTSYAYDPAGNLTKLTEPSGAYKQYGYDEANRGIEEQVRDAADNLVVSYSTEYDSNGNRTSETETRSGRGDRTTSYEYDLANRLTRVQDPYGFVTSYTLDALGNITAQSDPGGYTATITPNALNQPDTTVLTPQASEPATAGAITTLNAYDGRGLLDGWTTETASALVLTTTLGYNSNGYLDAMSIGHSGLNPATLTSSLAYYDDNLAHTVTQQGRGDRSTTYDDAKRVLCFGGSPPDSCMTYDGSGRRLTRDWQYYLWFYKHAAYAYEGSRLTGESASDLGGGVFYTRTVSYDLAGNVKEITKVHPSGVITLTYGWEPGTQHLIGVTHDEGGTPDVWTLEYDRQGRMRRLCSGGSCSTFGYVGESDWLAAVKRESDGAIVQRYLYTNGRPLAVENLNVFGSQYERHYYQYDWHGNVATLVGQDGSGGTGWTTYGAWGEFRDPDPWQYYGWNGAWGYLRLPAHFNFDLNDELDIGLYYAHGRWYNQDTGLWLSPDEKGGYFYGSGQDAVNDGWVRTSARVRLPDTGPWTGDLIALNYKGTIKLESQLFDIPWQVLAGVLESEIRLDTGLGEKLRDLALNMDPFLCDDFSTVPYCANPAGGIANIHILTARATSAYLSKYYGNSPVLQLGISETEPIWKIELIHLLPDPASIRTMAAIVRELADFRFGSNGEPLLTSHADLSRWTIADAVAIWHGYRYGVPSVSPGGQGFRLLADFQDRSYNLDDLIDKVVQIGPGSARASVPYFERYFGMTQ